MTIHIWTLRPKRRRFSAYWVKLSRATRKKSSTTSWPPTVACRNVSRAPSTLIRRASTRSTAKIVDSSITTRSLCNHTSFIIVWAEICHWIKVRLAPWVKYIHTCKKLCFVVEFRYRPFKSEKQYGTSPS